MRHVPISQNGATKKVMGIELFKKIVDDCFSEGIRNFNLNFYNEPFLDPLLFERVKYMKSKGLKVSFFPMLPF